MKHSWKVASVVALGAVLLAGCGLLATSAEIVAVRASGDEMTLTLEIDACRAEYSVEIQESAESVAVWMTAVNRTEDDCTDEYVIDLKVPLDGRIFIDGYDFTEVEVEPAGP